MAKPETNIKCGNIQASLWANKTDKGTMYSVSINKSYQDSKGNWQTSTSFSLSELPFIQIAIQKVLEYRYLKDDVEEKI